MLQELILISWTIGDMLILGLFGTFKLESTTHFDHTS